MRMRKRVALTLVGIVVGILVVPVVLAQVDWGERRSFTGVRLSEARFEEVTFPNRQHRIQLAGMLFRPNGEGPFPAAVVIQGSGTSRRDNAWYLTLTTYLQEHGIVVLLPDKRGSEQSEGDWRTASFDDLATDALAAVAYLSRQDLVEISHIGVIGMSQGGHIVPIVADRSADIAFVVNVVGAAVPMHELLVYEENHNLREWGVLPGLSDALAHLSSRMVRQRAHTFWDAVGNFDALPYWRSLSTDALVLYGEHDTNVPSTKSAELLRSLGKPNIDVRIYDGSGHALEDPPGKGNSIFRTDALEDIRDFIRSSYAGNL